MERYKPNEMYLDEIGDVTSSMYDTFEKFIDISEDSWKFDNDFFVDLESLMIKYLGDKGYKNYN